MDYTEQNTLILGINRTQVRFYCSGTYAPEVHILETYATGEPGGRLLCVIDITTKDDAEKYAAIFQNVAKDFLIKDYIENRECREQIVALAQKAATEFTAQKIAAAKLKEPKKKPHTPKRTAANKR